MNSLSRLVRTGATLGVGAAAVLAIAAGPIPASATEQGGVSTAAGGWERCPVGSVCIFDGQNGTGKMAYFQQGSQDLRLQGMDNMTESWWNRTDRRFDGYDGYFGDQGRYVFGSDPTATGYNLWGSEQNSMSSIIRR